MSDHLRLKKSNCKNCYKCIRNCPVKSIRLSAGQANIIGDECILCGHCFVVCPQGAKEIVDETDDLYDYPKTEMSIEGKKIYRTVINLKENDVFGKGCLTPYQHHIMMAVIILGLALRMIADIDVLQLWLLHLIR